jgi:uncharacterized protein YkwD
MPRTPLFVRMVPLTLVCLLAVAAGTVESASAMTRSESKLLSKVNGARANYGLRKLRVKGTLQKGAHYWAKYLQRRNAFYHGRVGDGVTENIGWVSCRRGWASTLVRWWLDSYAHRVNLLDRSARYIGVGVAKGSFSRYSCTKMAVTRFK